MIFQDINDKTYSFPFRIYTPGCKAENIPLIVQLHGAGEVGNGGDDLPLVTVHGFSKELEEHDYPCCFVMPQCPTGSFWAAEIPNIRQFIDQLVSNYPIDTSRMYLTGLSMGGYGTWLTAERYPEVFAAIAPVCGGGMEWRADVLNLPIWAFHGTEDDIVSPEESLKMIRKVRAGNSDYEVRLTMLDGIGHNAWDYAYNGELISWLLRWKKGKTK